MTPQNDKKITIRSRLPLSDVSHNDISAVDWDIIYGNIRFWSYSSVETHKQYKHSGLFN